MITVHVNVNNVIYALHIRQDLYNNRYHIDVSQYKNLTKQEAEFISLVNSFPNAIITKA